MSKITKFVSIHVLAFFILAIHLFAEPACAQDVKRLENGLRVIVGEDHRNPLVVFSVFIDIGAASEGEYLGSGMSHLIEHMLFKGSKKYPPSNIETILHIYGGNIDAFTTHDYTGIRITILKENLDVALDVLKEMLIFPLFSSNELNKEKEVIEREMELSRDDPSRWISRLAFSNAFIRHPYRVPVIGYRENFQRIERADVVNFFESTYTPERMILAVAGDVNEDDILAKVKEIFGGIPRGDNKFTALPEEPLQTGPRFIEDRSDIDGAYVNIAFHSTSILDKDLYALDLLAFILGEGESSVLNEEIRIKKALALSLSAYNYTPRYPGLFVISAVLKEEHLNSAVAEILSQIGIIKDHGVTEEEIEKAKNNFLAHHIYQKESLESKADDLALGELFAGNPMFFDGYIEHIKSVTLDDIKRAANEYLTRDNMTVAVVSKSGKALESGSELILQKEERKIGKIILTNGMTVIVSEDHSLPILAVSLLFKGGLRIETKDNNGISKMVSSMLMDGTGAMTREEIAQFYESKGMMISPYSGNSSLGISVSCLKEHLEDAIRLVSELCTDSIFSVKELEREKRESLAAIDMQDNQLFNYGHRLLKGLLFKVHPYGLQPIGSPESIARMTREDILKFHDCVLSAQNMILGISGDCNTEEIKVLLEKYFSKVPSKEPGYSMPQEEPPIESKRELAINTDREQSLVMIGFCGIDIYNGDRYAVEVMVDAFSRESGVLFRSIREKKGLSYATGAFQVQGMDPGYILAYAFSSRENIGRVKDIILAEIESFIKTGISGEELKKSKNHLKAMQQMELVANSSFIFAASLDELYGLGYMNYKDYNKNIESVTAENVKKAAQKLLTLDRCAIVILEGKD